MPSAAKTDFDAATVRCPPRAAAEMALAAAAARTRPGAPVWIYGARVEGVFSAARENGRETVVKRSLFRDVSVVFASACGGFAVVAATRADDFREGGDDERGIDGFKTVTTLVLPRSNAGSVVSARIEETTEPAETVPNWASTPLFRGLRDGRFAAYARPFRSR